MEKILTDGTIRLRPFSIDDVQFWYEAACESIDDFSKWIPNVTKNYTIEQAKEYVHGHVENWKKETAFGFVVQNVSDFELVGGCGISFINNRHKFANLWCWTRKTATRNGFSYAALKLVAQFGFSELGLERLELVVVSSNKKSIQLVEKLEPIKEGILRNRIFLNGSSHDAIIYSLIPGEV